MELPGLDEIYAARDRIAPFLPPTPMWSYPAFNAEVGAQVFIKHENVQPVGAFKVRGGLNLVGTLTDAERAAGVITYSTGNHAQSIAYAAREHGVTATIVMPAVANEAKVRAIRALGAETILVGDNLEVAAAHARELAKQRGARLIDAGNEPALIAGVASLYLEILESQPDLDAIIVPIGSGTGGAAACLVAAAIAPRAQIIGVQSAASPAGHDSWRAGEIVQRPSTTRIEGVATGSGFELTQRALKGLADFLLVSDDEIADAQRLLATHAHTLAEGAGAAGVAGLRARPDLKDLKIAIPCTGGNASAQELAGLSA